MPKISVIIPVYNVENYLARCLESLVNQTLKDIEIICINDGSTDNSLNILRDWEKLDNRISIIDLPKNQGTAIAKNKGLEIAQGEYLGFVDPDDEIELDFYEKLYNCAINNQADIAKAVLKTINGEQITISTLNNSIRYKNNNFVFSYEWTTAIYRREIASQNNICFPEECQLGEDIVFLTKMLCKSKSLALIDDAYYVYHRRNDSLDSQQISLSRVKSVLRALEIIFEELNSSNLITIDKKAYAQAYANRISTLFRVMFQNESKEVRFLCAKALIDFFTKCLDKEGVKDIFTYPWMLGYIENKDCEKLNEIFCKIKSRDDLANSPIKDKNKKLIEYIFSIKNSGRHKVICVLGLKIKFKK